MRYLFWHILFITWIKIKVFVALIVLWYVSLVHKSNASRRVSIHVRQKLYMFVTDSDVLHPQFVVMNAFFVPFMYPSQNR